MAVASPPPALLPIAKSPPVLTHTLDVQHTEYDLFLIHHFMCSTVPSFDAGKHSGVYTNQALDIAKEYPFLMHTMIALAACHLQHLGVDARQYRRAEALHCHFASQGLRVAVSRPIRGARDSDAILTTSMLLNTLTFCAAEYREEEGMSIGTGTEPRYEWLRIQIGLTGLLTETTPFHPDSIWMFLFVATQLFQFTEPPQNDLDRKLAEFCGIDESSTSDNNVYFDLVERLGPIVVRQPSVMYKIMYLNAIGGVSSKFVDLLEAKETKALLLFAHLLSLLCSIDQWWCVKRTKRECWKMCSILSNRLDADQLYLLKRPADTCGFLLDSEGTTTKARSKGITTEKVYCDETGLVAIK